MISTDTRSTRQPQPSPAKVKSAVLKENSRLLEAARMETPKVLAWLGTPADGLTTDAAAEKLALHGPNEVGQEKRQTWIGRLLHTLWNPLVILLSILATIAFWTAESTADVVGGVLMVAMVVLGVGLRFIQESKADVAAAKLKAMIKVTATVQRSGKYEEVPLRDLVPGDLVKLSAGDMIPADVRLIASKDLFLTQATLTGESLPVEKFDTVETRPNISALELANVCYLGTSVESGTATAVVIETGAQSFLGGMAKSMSGQQVETSFDKGVHKFTMLMIKFMLVMAPLVFLINGFVKGNWKEAFMFAVAVAVGLTPEMLPMIVSVCLSKGALAMSRKKVIVKRLNSIQNFGAMDVLCTDKTGTLTMDHVILEKHCDVFQNESDIVLQDAYLISHFQTGLKNVLDRAILQHTEAHSQLKLETYRKVDEIPFDFSRKMMSVVVETPEGDHLLLTKGAPEPVFQRCTHFESDGEIFPMEPILVGNLIEQYRDLSEDGFRVLAVASRLMDKKAAYSKVDESELVLKGYVAFLDPPKESAAKAIAALQQHGVAVKVLTGDNELVTRKVCREVGIPADKMLLGSDVEHMSDTQLGIAAEETRIFARLSPSHKQRVIETLRRNGHVVGFMGDGINDAPALRAADVGISVDNAVDIAKESADMILLEKSLMVLEEGVMEGRTVFVNILKYIRMGASSNFGNMFSVIGASALLPWLPMTPLQILANNLLYDFSQVPIPTDNVDPEQIAKPRPWHMGTITKFILFIGPISSIFDYTTFFAMLYLFKCANPPNAKLFQTGWLVESLMTQTLIIHVIRTRGIPFIQAKASLPLTFTTISIMMIGAWLPFSPLASSLGLVRLPLGYWPFLIGTLLCYVCLTQAVKSWLIRKSWV